MDSKEIKQQMKMQLRLDKLLADAGFGTRSTVRDIIKKGSVTVDGTAVRTPDSKVDITSSSVEVDGTPVFYEKESYYVLFKPAGILSASRDGREKTVIDLIPEPRRRDLFPVGRLDRDTVGLLIITNDGKLNNRLMAPGKHVEKTYRAVVSGQLPEDCVERFASGLDIGDENPTLPAKLSIEETVTQQQLADILSAHGLSPQTETPSRPGDGGSYTQITLTLTEGRYHQVKRMFEAVGCKVLFLKRISIGGLNLPENLVPGEVIKMSQETLINNVGL